MQTHYENQETSSALTTEDLARSDPAGDDERTAAVYPGEATGDATLGESPTDRDDTAAPDLPAESDAESDEQSLLAPEEAERYRTAWSEIQAQFVDDPRQAVTSADTLVAEVMQSLAGTFATHKKELEGQWRGGGDVATEDLRLALQHYRSFFNRLLKT